jgi:hypothetical protein
VAAGEVIAQAIFVHRAARSAEIQVVPAGGPVHAQLQGDLLRWYASHADDRSVYKKLARSRHGRADAPPGDPLPL